MSNLFGVNSACIGGGYVFGDALSWIVPGPGKIGKILKIRKAQGGARGGAGTAGGRAS